MPYPSRRLALAGVFSALAAPALARVDLPEEAGVFVAKVDGTLQALEAQLPRTGGGFGGFAGGKIGLVIQGPHSPVRFRAGQRLSFLLRLPGPTLNPATPAMLWRAKSQAKARRAELGYGMPFSGVSGSPDVVSTELSRPAERILEITPQVLLYPGEYMLGVWGQSGDTVSGLAYAFGID